MAFRHLALTALVLSCLGGAPLAQARPLLDEQRLLRLERWDVVSFTDPAGSGAQRHRAVGMFNASPEAIFKVATDYEQYTSYIPRLIGSHVMWQGADQALGMLEAELPWPLRNSWSYAPFQPHVAREQVSLGRRASPR